MGGLDAGRTAWRIAVGEDVTVYAFILKQDTYICWFSCEL